MQREILRLKEKVGKLENELQRKSMVEAFDPHIKFNTIDERKPAMSH